jgi:hypothetical protein
VRLFGGGCNFARKAALKEEKIWLSVAFRAVTSFLSLAPFFPSAARAARAGHLRRTYIYEIK